MPSCSRRGGGGVLEADRDVQRAGAHALDELVRRALGDVGLDLGPLGVSRASARGTRVASALGNAPMRSSRAACPASSASWPAGELQPVGDDVGVLEQQRARRRERQPAGPALEQLRARLALERRDLLRDRGLGQRQRLGRARERAEPRDLAERQHAARVDHRLSLWHRRKR